MLPTFLAQFAAGCYLAVAGSAIQQSGWKYLRLMAVVCLCLTLIALVTMLRDPVAGQDAQREVVKYGLSLGLLFGGVWLFANAGQGEAVRNTQRLWPLLAGLCCLVAAVALVLRPDTLIRYPGADRITAPLISSAVTTILGAGMLGTVTAAMLLGHRYLTDTDMPIAPLRRLAKIYLIVVGLRFVWLGFASIPVFSAGFHPRGDYTWFWLMVCIRGGVGVFGTGVFAWMVWDCVKRRATQSATALFYLSMIFVFLGELAGQYLTRTESLAM
ncbi:MAG: hypothetical protein AABZ08_09475 [Planctomycetota bacterium]